MITRSLGSFGLLSVPAASDAAPVLPNAVEMAELDRATIAGGTPSLHLMERAGTAVYEIVKQHAPSGSQVTILCGSGNNGGDGIVIARLLSLAGYQVVTIVAPGSRYSVEMDAQLKSFPAARFFETSDSGISERETKEVVAASSVVVDALLGTGSKGAPRGSVARLISIANTCRTGVVIAVDIPAGLDPDTGLLHESHIQADLTVTLQCVKRGMLQFPGRTACGGRIISADIGIRIEKPVEFSLVVDGFLPRIFPGTSSRRADVHKGNLGRVAIIAGSRGMQGAGILSSLGALKTGAGLVTRVTASAWPVLSFAPPECMTHFVAGEYGSFGARDVTELFGENSSFAPDAAVLGPGLSVTSDATAFVEGVVERAGKAGIPLVIDADALTIIAASGASSKPRFSGLPFVITPHPGEAARLLGSSTKDVQADRFSAVRELSNRYGCAAVLKGAGSLVYSNGEGKLIARGTPYLATAGSGDVLCGVIAALLARGLAPIDAATLGVYVHAVAGESAAATKGGPIIASDIAEAVSYVVGSLERSC